MNISTGPSGISPIPSQRCDASIHPRGINTDTNANISVAPARRSVQASMRSLLIKRP